MSNKKLIHLLRHGRTEMNEHLADNPGDHRGGAASFKDPLLYPLVPLCLTAQLLSIVVFRLT